MYQVLFTVSPLPAAAQFTIVFANSAERDRFVQGPGVWWYHLPELDDDWGWHRGGAWGAIPGTEPVGQSPPVTPAVALQEEGEEDDDDRW